MIGPTTHLLVREDCETCFTETLVGCLHLDSWFEVVAILNHSVKQYSCDMCGTFRYNEKSIVAVSASRKVPWERGLSNTKYIIHGAYVQIECECDGVEPHEQT